MAGRRRPSAALVLGVLSGCIAALTVFPTAIPLSWRLGVAEQAVAERHVRNGLTAAEARWSLDHSLPPGTLTQLDLDHLHVRSDGLLAYQEGRDLDVALFDPVCALNSVGEMVDSNGQRWIIACHRDAGLEVATAIRPRGDSATTVVLFVFTLAAIVGLITALGVLRLLAPLSRLSRAIVRVGGGERGVRVEPATGLAELDELAERVNAAAQALEARDDAILGRIKAVQEMARMVAHEVRNPLQSLELLTSLIASEDDAKERHELAQAIHSEIRALDTVVTRVLREGATTGSAELLLQRVRQSVGPLIDQVLAVRRPEAKVHGIQLEVGEVAAVTADIDSALLSRSIENFIVNAFQAVPPTGGRVRISLLVEPDHFAVVVEDNGPGVDPGIAQHMFEANVTGRTGGTGLGLALVREVITAHGGYITYDRSPLGGAQFTARVPREAPSGQVAERPHR